MNDIKVRVAEGKFYEVEAHLKAQGYRWSGDGKPPTLLTKSPVSPACFLYCYDNGSIRYGTSEEYFLEHENEEYEIPKPKEKTAPKNPNPKDSIGATKIPMHLWPASATMLGAIGLLDGAGKYGRQNYRGSEVRASIYYDAACRHLNAWFEGEETDPDSGVPHLGHALACLAILVDSKAAGKLIDDRNVQGGYRAFINDLTPHVKRLQALHADKNPKHLSIKDNDELQPASKP